MHIQRMLEADCLHGTEARRCVRMTDPLIDGGGGGREEQQSLGGGSQES